MPLTLASPAPAQDEGPAEPVVVSHLAGSLHLLRFNGNVAAVASVGEDGILLVDSGFAGTADAAQRALRELGEGPLRLILNTHGDGDHVGGNALLGRDATIVAHSRVREQMTHYFSLPDPNQEGNGMLERLRD